VGLLKSPRIIDKLWRLVLFKTYEEVMAIFSLVSFY